MKISKKMPEFIYCTPYPGETKQDCIEFAFELSVIENQPVRFVTHDGEDVTIEAFDRPQYEAPL